MQGSKDKAEEPAWTSQPMTNLLTAGVTHEDWEADGAIKWGDPKLNLPVFIDAPNGWAEHIQKYNGTGVWVWQDFQEDASATILPNRLADDYALLDITHGTKDHVVLWDREGKPMYPSLDAGWRAWGGLVTDDDHYWMYYQGLPPSMAGIGQDLHRLVPFWNLQVIRDETVPAISRYSGDFSSPPQVQQADNLTVKWSSSWDAWDGQPVDETGLWEISLCTVRPANLICGGKQYQTADITPRRVQNFSIVPGVQYDWENRQVSDNRLVARGIVTADNNRLITVKAFRISPSGNRLILKPHPHGNVPIEK